jgi:hypothetical protein
MHSIPDESDSLDSIPDESDSLDSTSDESNSLDSTSDDSDYPGYKINLDHIFLTLELSGALELSREKVFMLETPHPFHSDDYYETFVRTPKLVATCFGEWQASVKRVSSSYFKSRKNYEEFLLPRRMRDGEKTPIVLGKISLREALALLKIDVTCNTSYYLANRAELEHDLKRQIAADVDLGDELVLKKLEQELFYNMMIKLFVIQSDDDDVQVDGENIFYGKSFMIRDYKLLHECGNEMMITAERGFFYFELKKNL